MNIGDSGSPFVPFTDIRLLATMLLNKLSGEGLFDERPTAQKRVWGVLFCGW